LKSWKWKKNICIIEFLEREIIKYNFEKINNYLFNNI
jgi:hypothetical protein